LNADLAQGVLAYLIHVDKCALRVENINRGDYHYQDDENYDY
jgi:hypothetical protein